MGNPLAQLMTLLQGNGGWAPDVQRSGVRPDFGLSSVQSLGGMAKSPYERTLRPGEQRSGEELRDMLAEVILAAGGAVVPGVGPKGQARQAPGRVRPGYEKQFAEWFKGSKLADEKGEPLTLYHGTGSSKPIDQFKVGKAFLTTDRGRANTYAQTVKGALQTNELDGSVYPVHVSAKKPFVVRTEGDIDMMRSPEMMAQLRSEGYDAIVSAPNRWTGERIVLPLVEGITKAAFGNRGTYNPNSADIRE